MKHHIVIPARILGFLLSTLNDLQDIGALIVRFWVAKIFLASALSKVTDWGATIVLFKYEYAVPILSPSVAAYIGTFAEFFLPIMLILGLGGRLFVFAFFVYNIICVVSFNFLWTPSGAAGLSDHINWGLLLMLLMLNGCGRISIDYLIHKKWGYLLHIGKPGDNKIHLE
jgi:putative oxidoreductase